MLQDRIRLRNRGIKQAKLGAEPHGREGNAPFSWDLVAPLADAKLLQVGAIKQVIFGEVEVIPDKLQFTSLSLMMLSAFNQLLLGVTSTVVHAFDFVGLHAGNLVNVNERSLAMMLNAF